MFGYRRLNCCDRESIMILRTKGFSQQGIADIIGTSQFTISRELQKGIDRGEYTIHCWHKE
jgi:IS30 family transposase